jgi:WD40 repeat protein
MLKLLKTLEGHSEDRVWHAAWSPNGLFLATCGEDKSIRIWDAITFEQIATLEEGQSRTIRSCEWSPDGNMIASASFDWTVAVWESRSCNMRSWELAASLEGHESEVKSVSWSRNGNYLATCGRDKAVWIWERLKGVEFECVAILKNHAQDVKFVLWHPLVDILFSASYDDTIKVWAEDAGDWYCANTLSGHISTVWGCTFNRSGTRFISCSDDNSLVMWSTMDMDKLLLWQKECRLADVHAFTVYSVDWDLNSNYIVSAGADNAIRLYRQDESLLHELCSVSNAHSADINCVRYNENLMIFLNRLYFQMQLLTL